MFFSGENVSLVFKTLYYLSFVLIPVALVWIIWDLWVMYRRLLFFGKQTYILLEIKLPKEIFKSPQAMEFCIAGMYQTGGEGGWYEKFWKGQVRPWYSLEIVSLEGAVHFFIWTRKGSKAQIEANLYSQYPGVEIYEVPDYTLPFYFNPETLNIWTSEFALTKADYYPIKTYIDYGLDKDPKEEYKIDPMTPLIEFLGGIGRGHQAWIQIILRAHKAEDKDPKTYFGLIDSKWSKGAQKEVETILKAAKGDVGADGKVVPGTSRSLTDVEKDTVKALGRSVSKSGFDVGIRAIYASPKDTFNPSNIGGIIGGITHFNSHLNGFKPTGGPSEKYKYLPWKSRSIDKINAEKQSLLDAYKKRAFFYKPHKKQYFVLNTEELATLFHFPGSAAATPTFTRVDSKKSEAPANLPV